MLTKIDLKAGGFYVSLERFYNELENLTQDGERPYIIFSYNAFDEIVIENEINGVENNIKTLAEISQELQSTVFCGIKSNYLGLRHISVVVCHKGRLVDIVDRTSISALDDFLPSEKIKIFSNGDANIAVLVDGDILLEKNWLRTVPHCNVIISIISGNSEKLLSAAYGFAQRFNVELIAVNDNSVVWLNN